MSSDNFEKRLDKVEAMLAKLMDTGLKLTTPGGEAVVLHISDADAIAEAKAAGKMVWTSDEPLPTAGVIV